MKSTTSNVESGTLAGVSASLGMESAATASGARVWQIQALCQAVTQALEQRFNPVLVRGEISGFSRASSGHCYFSLKDESAQIRCAMFRRAAGFLEFSPRDGELVELHGRLGVYEARGDLQLIVESMRRAGQGALLEQFARLKAKLEGLGLFDAGRKRPLRPMPRAIGVVTSLDAAALHDVMTALQRRVPHIPVILAPAAVQGLGAPAELVQALSRLYAMHEKGKSPIDVILLVRGGGSIEDLWAFNDEQLAFAIAQSPVPVVCGVGHETDFTIADFVADLRAPTPTAAAEMASQPRDVWLARVDGLVRGMQIATRRQIEQRGQRLDLTASRLGRPSERVAQQRLQLSFRSQRLNYLALDFLKQRQQHLQRAALRLGLLDPSLVLHRGYAWLTSSDGRTIGSVHEARPGQAVQAILADGKLDLIVADIN